MAASCPTPEGVSIHINTAADLIGVAPYAMRDYIRRGLLPAVPVSGRTYLQLDDLKRFARGHHGIAEA